MCNCNTLYKCDVLLSEKKKSMNMNTAVQDLCSIIDAFLVRETSDQRFEVHGNLNVLRDVL